MNQENFFTITDAAHILKFSVSKTYKLVEKGILVGTRYGGSIRFTMQQLMNPNPTPQENPNGRLRRQTKRKLLLPV